MSVAVFEHLTVVYVRIFFQVYKDVFQQFNLNKVSVKLHNPCAAV